MFTEPTNSSTAPIYHVATEYELYQQEQVLICMRDRLKELACEGDYLSYVPRQARVSV